MYSIFKANYLQDQLDAEAKGTTGYAAVRPKNLLPAKIPLPPFPEQRRIVSHIEELAALLFAKLNEIFSTNGKNDLKIMKLADVCDTTSGGTPSRHRFDFFENGSVP